MFTEGYDEAQLEEMNTALIQLIRLQYCGFKEAKQLILKAKTAFFQSELELYETAKRFLEERFEKNRNRGFASFSTVTDSIEKRKTYKYADGYSYLDEWEFIGRAEVISCEMRRDYNDCDETSTQKYVLRATVKNGYRIKEMKAALFDHFNGTSCTHEHDCCGCWSYRVRKVKHIKLGVVDLFEIIVGGSRNY